MGSSKKKTTQVSSSDSTQTNAPPSWTLPGLEKVAGQVTDAASKLPTSVYSGPMVARMSGKELSAIQNAWKSTATNAGSLAGWMQNRMKNPGWTTELPTDSFTPTDAMNLQPVIDASIHPVFRQLTEEILPGIRSSALDAGAYSGDRAMKVLPTQVIDKATESAQRIAAQLGYEDYNNREDRRLQAWEGDQDRLLAGYGAETGRVLGELQLMPDLVNGVLSTQASQGDLLRMAAELGVSNRQAGIQNRLAQDEYSRRAPFVGLDNAAALLAQLSGGWGTQTGKTNSRSQTTEVTKQDPVMQAIQGAVGIGSMVAGFPGGPAMLGSLFGGAKAAAPAASSIFNQRVASLPSFMGG